MFNSLLRERYFTFFSRHFCTKWKVTFSESALVKEETKMKSLVEYDCSRRTKNKFQEFFIETLLLNRFQEKVLEYPQIDTLDEFNILKKHYSLAQNLIDSKTEDEHPELKGDSKKAASTLKQYELVGFKLPRIKNGFGYLHSEYTFIQEALAVDPSLSKIICEQENYGIYLIDKFGSDTQKEQYLYKLTTGESIACLANIEKETLVSLQQDCFSTSSEISSDKESYIISGTKCWVYNADCADLFIVSANIISDGHKESKPTFFLIDRNTPGIEIHEPVDKIGFKNLSICDVTFNNVVVPTTSVLGNVNEGDKLTKSVVSQGKLNIGGHCLGAMRKFLQKAIQHCIHNELFKENKTDISFFKAKIGNMASRIYVVESMTYLLTGRLDCHEDPNVFLESIIVKIFASETFQFIVQQTLEILGPEFFSDENKDLRELADDAQFYVASDDSNGYLKLILSVAGLEFKYKYRKNRSFRQLISDLINNERSKPFLLDSPDIIKTKNQLFGYLHKIFSEESNLLEHSVASLHFSTNYLILAHKDKLFERPMELRYIAEMLISIYAMTATLARASRAYCLCVKFHDFDKLCTEAEILRLFFRVQLIESYFRRPELLSIYSKTLPFMMNFNKYSDLFSVLRPVTIQEKMKHVKEKITL